MTTTAYKWSIDRYHQIIAAGILDEPLVEGLRQRSVELLQGEIIVMSPPPFVGIMSCRFFIRRRFYSGVPPE